MKYVNIIEYIKLSRQERREHLRLDDPCIEIGGCSYNFKGLLAHYLKTSIPIKEDRIYLCHACHNGKCSYPKHLYWGTYKDNHIDAVENGALTIQEKCIRKFGGDDWCVRHKESGKILGSKYGKFFGGTNKYNQKQIERIQQVLLDVDVSKYGWVKRSSDKLGLSHTQVRRLKEKYFPDMMCNKRKTRG